TQNIPCHVLEFAEQFDVILNTRMRHCPLITAEQRFRLRDRIGRINYSLRLSVADRRNEIIHLAIHDPVDRFTNDLVLSADLATDAQQRATQDRTAFLLKLREAIVNKIKVPVEPLQWRNRR